MLHSEVFLSGHALQTFTRMIFYYNADATSENSRVGLRKATGLREGVVECVVLVSVGLDSPRGSNCRLWLPRCEKLVEKYLQFIFLRYFYIKLILIFIHFLIQCMKKYI